MRRLCSTIVLIAGLAKFAAITPPTPEGITRETAESHSRALASILRDISTTNEVPDDPDDFNPPSLLGPPER
jgi:hypothetical protein